MRIAQDPAQLRLRVLCRRLVEFKRIWDIYHRAEHGSNLPLRQRNSAPANPIRSVVMPTTSSPVEYLIVFGIVFVAGVLTTVGFRHCTEKVRREAMSHA